MTRLPYAAVLLAATLLSGFALAQDEGPAAGEARALLEYERNTIEVVQAAARSVVTVSVEVQGRPIGPLEGFGDDQAPPSQEFFQQRPPQLQEGTGSGFVIDEGHRILTNYHVVRLALAPRSVEARPGARITVRLPGMRESFPVRVVGANALYDLALLEFEDVDALPDEVRGVAPLALGDSDAIVPGQKAIAIGSPFGFESTVTVGTVSGLARRLVDVAEADLPFIQTDTAINPGSSGGPLLDSSGEVIGINTAILPGSTVGGPRGFIGLGFAVPSNVLKRVLPELAAGGFVDIAARPRLGVSAIGLDAYPDAVRTALGLPEAGVMLIEVEAGGPAEAAGLRGADGSIAVSGRSLPTGGDVVTRVDGVPVRAAGDLQAAVLARASGDTLELSVWRGGELRLVVVRLAVVPSGP
jgi:serine protease Do